MDIQESINKMDQSTILIKSYKTSNKILISVDLSIINETPKTFLKYKLNFYYRMQYWEWELLKQNLQISEFRPFSNI